jgi:hypothetical protein
VQRQVAVHRQRQLPCDRQPEPSEGEEVITYRSGSTVLNVYRWDFTGACSCGRSPEWDPRVREDDVREVVILRFLFTPAARSTYRQYVLTA